MYCQKDPFGFHCIQIARETGIADTSVNNYEERRTGALWTADAIVVLNGLLYGEPQQPSPLKTLTALTATEHAPQISLLRAL